MSKYFDIKRVKELVYDCEVEREYGENRRWQRSVTSIVEDTDGKFYSIDWQEGLTECQENDFEEGEYQEVEKVTYEKTVEVTEWKVVK